MGYLKVRNVGKAYKRYPGKWARLAEWITGREWHEKHWVLRDINFEVDPGEAVGIIGVNGAGKSTLLKIITGTTQPTTGSIDVGGHIAALLELGMGFHPDFTGRQNVYMGGQILGLFTEKISELMPEIEAFAGIGDYIDQPLRTYSSGMQMRLAFAVATAIRPDILIVDEALSVGDAAFQRKCFQRIENFRDQGTTLLFVSHDIETVKRLCNTAVFLHYGSLKLCGNAKAVCNEYEQTLFGAPKKNSINKSLESSVLFDPALDSAAIEKQYGNGGAVISAVSIRNSSGEPVNIIPEGTPFSVTYQIKFIRPACGVKFGMMIKTVDGICIYATNTTDWLSQTSFNANEEAFISFKLQGNLVPGIYYLNTGSTQDLEGGPEFLHRRVDCLIFRVTSSHWRYAGGYANLFALPELNPCS